MNWVDIMTKLLPFIIELIHVAEEAFSDQPKSGEKKKELVMEAVKTVTGAATELSTGGQKNTWEKISEPISRVIDAACSFFFK